MRVIFEGGADFASAIACGRTSANAGESRSGRKRLRFIGRRLRGALTPQAVPGVLLVPLRRRFEEASPRLQVRLHGFLVQRDSEPRSVRNLDISAIYNGRLHSFNQVTPQSHIDAVTLTRQEVLLGGH